jgi:hypothetical protein
MTSDGLSSWNSHPAPEDGKCLVDPRYVPPAKDVLQTYSGVVVRPLEPRLEDIKIEDIAWSLAHQCRYNGHTKMFYSVATHCILVSKFLPRVLQLDGLLHDASEAYLSDLPSPVKQVMPEYRRIEAELERRIAAAFGLQYPMHPEVKWADDHVFQLEVGLVMGGRLGEKFAIEDGARPLVEQSILAHAALSPPMVAAEFIRVYQGYIEHRERRNRWQKA